MVYFTLQFSKNMKHIPLLSFLICALMVLLVSCEQADIQKSTNNSVVIEPRNIHCSDCPVNDCCCAIELLGSSKIPISIFVARHHLKTLLPNAAQLSWAIVQLKVIC